jgi:hypothetical protein
MCAEKRFPACASGVGGTRLSLCPNEEEAGVVDGATAARAVTARRTQCMALVLVGGALH